MTKRERFIGFFMVSVILIWLYVALSGDDTTSPIAKPPSRAARGINKNVVKGSTSGIMNKIDLTKLEKKIKEKAATEQFNDMRSPFIPIKRKEKPRMFDIEQLDLMGVFFEQGIPNAIINDQLLRVGDQIMGCTIENITQNRVTVVHGHDRFILTLYPDSRNKRAAS